MEMSNKMLAVAAVLVLAVAVGAEARNIKTAAAAAEQSKDTVVQPQTFPPFDRFGSTVPAFGGLPGSSGSSIPGFSLPGTGGSTPGFGSIGSMPIFGGLGGLGGSPGLGGGMPGSPAAASVDKHAKKP
ncbi:hypothetical protein ABZP36_025146 [Zizania latifolia]